MQFLTTVLIYVVPFLLVLGVVVTVHELGHFLVARSVGTKIDGFSIGFGRAIATWRDKDGVEWRIGWLPIGGYVKFAGDDNAASIPDGDHLEAMRRSIVAREGEAALSRYFHFKPLWQRAAITAAGPFANFALAIVVFAALLMIFGEPMGSTRVDAVDPGSPAEAAGFRVGDEVLEVNGKRIERFDKIRELVVLSSDTPMRFLVRRAGSEIEIVATPRRGVIVDPLGREQKLGKLGLRHEAQAGDRQIKRYGLPAAVLGGVDRTWTTIGTTVTYIGRMITGRETAEQLSGPLGIAQFSGDIAKRTSEVSTSPGALAVNGLLTFAELVGVISVGIGFMNLLPIPVLDGGHLMFYAYEAVARRPLAAKVQAAGYRVGLALVLGLMLFATWNDLQRLRVFNLFDRLVS